MPTVLSAGALALLLVHATAPSSLASSRLAADPRATAILDTALARMGGLPALRAIERVQLESMVEWQRHTLDPVPGAMVSSYERSTELRDYARPAWRFTRHFYGPAPVGEIVNVVADSVAAISMGGRWRPQNVAYVDERDEAFTFSAERLLVLAREAADARALPDTLIAGARHARVVATVGRFRPTLVFRRGDGLLAEASFRAAQPNDFGLAPWGEMDVVVRYSRWARPAGVGVVLPTQLDVHRVGRPYKRVTLLATVVNPAIPADSFAIADSLRAAFLATARRPMHDLPLDSARIVDGAFAVFGAPGTPPGAVKIGGRWLLIESGTAPLSVERSADFLRRADPGAPLGGALLTAAFGGGAGGAAWLARQAVPTWVAGAARPYVEAVRRGWHVRGEAAHAVVGDRWIAVGRDSVRVEALDVPDYPNTVVVYVPSLRWAYSWVAGPAQAERVAAHVRRRGWQVDRLGSVRNLVGTPLPAASAGR